MKQLLCCWFYCPHGFLLWVSKTRHMIITLIDILSLSLPLSLCLSVCLSLHNTHTHTHTSQRERQRQRETVYPRYCSYLFHIQIVYVPLVHNEITLQEVFAATTISITDCPAHLNLSVHLKNSISIHSICYRKPHEDLII
jgi:hypothetical protein